MKTNILWISTILFFLWWIYRWLWWNFPPQPISSIDMHSWLLTLSFQSPIDSWLRYEGEINGSWSLSWDNNDNSIPMKWTLWFGYNATQSLLHFSGTLGWRVINIDYLIENNSSYIRSHHYEKSSSWFTDEIYSQFIDQLFGKLSDTNYQFVELQWYTPYRWISSVVSPQTIVGFLSEYFTIPPWWCTHQSCEIIIDTDFLTPWFVRSMSINPVFANYMSILWSHRLVYHHDPVSIIIHTMNIGSNTLQWVIRNDHLSLQLSTKWLINTLYHITHSIDHNNHTIDLDIDQEWEKTQSWRSSYKIFPDGFSAQLFGYSSDQQTISLSGERYRVWAYLPIDKGAVINIYGLLGK